MSYWGLRKVYPSIIKMVGEVDLEKTDLERGLFVSKTDYVSIWKGKKEIEEIRRFLKGKLINEVWEKEFCILHLSYL